jgi:spermidine/putrescine transport system permease protein
VILGMIHFLLPYMVLNVYVSLDGIDRNLISGRRLARLHQLAGRSKK